jgi:hypothetical protein
MANLTRDQVKTIVTTSLNAIADLPADVEAATFAMLNDQQKKVFLATLKSNLNASPYYQDDGSATDTSYYDVDLTQSSFANWPTVKDCIDWVTENQTSYPKN